ncbi:sodium:proton antiporter [Echinicola vietnamensis]|uniref:Na+/H+ antiporter NhaD-like permease n=1 Tax=Echinicola vietnamensis (strain DSM 17526 / LMG 23754 / KMM 6221) TaxID=926556 RepID=L0FWK5_ECHVK|nr:sodium:proton antiporter [Echinicola vietnamensis]AGA77136.1 Na+/H+ antiporter NhaD-like permease [Echinicola vietnamensis DSM 17526]
MKNIIIAFGIVWGAVFYTGSASLMAQNNHQTTEVSAHQEGHEDQKDHASDPHHADAHAEGEAEHAHAPVWLVIPFVVLLLMIATGPLFYEHFWHHNYPKVAIILAALVVLYYIFAMHNTHAPVHALAEYLQFIALLASLYIASGGIMISIDKKSTPLANVTLLIVGSIIANLIGTTGASMLLIRPFIRLNKNNIRAYHIIFFIFMVSNVGGSLTPIGDPPLFLGFLKGVPFFWTLEHNWPAWIIALIILATAFFFIDKKLGCAANDDEIEDTTSYSNKISLIGSKNFLWLLIVIISVFLDPNVLDWVPAIVYDGTKFSFIRELIMFSVAFFSYKFADKRAIKGNEFNFEPIREVAFIFIGIFGTMMPALELVGNFAKSPAGAELITHNSLYWGTGLLSGFLDNAPTYLNFLAAAMASRGATISDVEMVRTFAMDGYHDSAFQLMAISIASVFFGAMTYIGNGPNFMVKSIAEQSGIKMPSFFGYIIRFSIPILLPVLIITWLIFFAFV